ncbi:MAG: POTRA domain-containing protein, partial [Rikenellaceae bacterium]
MKQRLVFILCICLVAVFWNSKGSFAQTKENTEDSVKVFYPTLNYNSPKEYVIEDVKVSGVQFLSSDLIISNTGITKGDTIYLPSDYITNSINQLWAQRCFSNVKVLVETEGNKAFLEIVLQERPRVSAWYFEGIKSSDEKKLRNDQLRLRERTEVSDFALKTSKDIILKYLKEKGYRNAEVNIRQKPDTLLDNFVTITFDIDKGEKVKIEEITFEGNEQLEEKKLKLAMKKTRERGLINILKSAKLNDQDFKDDKALLSDYMQSNGFRDGVLISDSIYAINDKRIGIKLTISEGQKYYYRNINWTGNVKYPDWYLEEQLRIKEGDVYDKLLMQEQLGIGSEGAMAAFNGARNVSTIYQNDGHLNFELIPVETVISGDSIDIDIRINEGNQYTINNVTISGNSRTNDRVIRRELAVRPGELYDQSMLYYTMRQLGNMGHFNAETISPDIRPISDDLTDVIFGVEEIPSDNIELSGGWGSGMFIASVGLNLNNVSIRNFFEKGAWKPYPTGDNQQISVSIQSNGTYYQAMSLSFLEPWLGGKKPTSLSTSVFYSSQSDSYYVYDESTSRFRTLGVSAGLGKRLTWPDPNFAIFGSLSYQSYNLTDWDSFLITDGTTNTIALSATLSRTSTDQGFYPR